MMKYLIMAAVLLAGGILTSANDPIRQPVGWNSDSSGPVSWWVHTSSKLAAEPAGFVVDANLTMSGLVIRALDGQACRTLTVTLSVGVSRIRLQGTTHSQCIEDLTSAQPIKLRIHGVVAGEAIYFAKDIVNGAPSIHPNNLESTSDYVFSVRPLPGMAWGSVSAAEDLLLALDYSVQ